MTHDQPPVLIVISQWKEIATASSFSHQDKFGHGSQERDLAMERAIHSKELEALPFSMVQMQPTGIY